MSLEWEDDAENWISFSKDSTVEMIKALHEKKSTIQLNVEMKALLISFETMVQMDRATRQEHRIRCCFSDGAKRFTWRWFDVKFGKWNTYPALTSIFLEGTWRKKQPTIRIVVMKRRFWVDMNKMVSVDEATSVSYKVERTLVGNVSSDATKASTTSATKTGNAGVDAETAEKMLDKLFRKDDGHKLSDHAKETGQVADALVVWDSKKHTGYVGLKNQGATCYLNSLLQTLFFTNQLRKAVYQVPADGLVAALQQVFFELQFSNYPVATTQLTNSFGWNPDESFLQHDVHELCRLLLNNLESAMKGTCVDGTIQQLFEGRMQSYVKCKHVNHLSSRSETFYDIQLNVKGKRNILESFKDYVTVESLEGDNLFDAGLHGKQEAEKGVIFLKFPPVLHLHLLRFWYDAETNQTRKITTRCEFPEILNLDHYLQAPDPSNPANYALQAVLVHRGSAQNWGHYYAFIKPQEDGEWFRFDDSTVSNCQTKEAIEANFIGKETAYMLVYIHRSHINTVLAPVSSESIPKSLKNRFKEEEQVEAWRPEKKNEASLIQIQVLLEGAFDGHQGNDLFDVDNVQYRTFHLKNSATILEFLEIVSKDLNLSVTQVRPWPFELRPNGTLRPKALDMKNGIYKTVQEILSSDSSLLFIETEPVLPMIQPFLIGSDVLLFLKKYEPQSCKITYCGHVILSASANINDDILPILWERGNFPPGTELLLYEEIKPNVIEEIKPLTGPLLEVIDELMDGDVLVFQRYHPNLTLETHEFATAKEFYRQSYCRTEVTFCDVESSSDSGFSLLLSKNASYNFMADAVAEFLGTEPHKLQFYKNNGLTDKPGKPISLTFEGRVKEIFAVNKTKQRKKLYYKKVEGCAAEGVQ